MSGLNVHASSDNSPDLASRLANVLASHAFFEEIWEHRELHLKSMFDSTQVQALFPLDSFDHVLTSGGLMSPHLDIVRGGRKLAAPFTQSPSPSTDVGKVLRDMEEGATLRVAHIEHYLPSVARFCRGLEGVIHAPLRANLYITPPFSQGFAPHYDLDDIFVVQVAGQKQWYWHAAYSDQALLPNADMPFDSKRHRSTAEPIPLLLNTGDVLYLPRGFMHEARTDDSLSIHVTFAVVGMKAGQLIEQLVRRVTVSDERMRRVVRIDVNSDSDHDAVASLAELVQACLNEAGSPDTLQEAVSFMKRYLASHRIPELRGRFLEGVNNGFGGSAGKA